METTVLHRWINPDTILLATNLHDIPHLLPHVVAQAKLGNAKVLLVHAVEPSYLRTNPAEGMPFVLPGPTLHSVQGKLNLVVKQFLQEGVLAEPIAVKGLPGEQIPLLIKERKADRVIVGTRSAEAIERVLLGSVAEDLLHQLCVPVCVVGPRVPPQVRSDQKPASILFATSFRRRSQQSAQLAFGIANLHRSRLTLLHVMPDKYASGEERQRLRRQREDELLGLITAETKLWSSPTVAIREGDPTTEILEEARELSADLIVLGTTGASKAARLLATGIVHRVIARAKAPVITLRQEPEIFGKHTHTPTTIGTEVSA